MMKQTCFLTAPFGSARVWCFVVLLSCFFGAGASAQDMTKQQLRQLYSNFLRAEGFSPTVDSDGDVQFKYEGGIYYIAVHEKDQQFFNLMYPNFWEIESEDELIQAVFAADTVTGNKKVVKVYLTQDWNNVSISVELFLKNPADFSTFFYRSMSLIAGARQDFIDEMSGQE
ncbi:MAG: hypothetical protein LBD24_09245 [Spirochaetaceae bacterium]|jgi:hypothetical protein|nr:hypothetical protein [Spirochaetaceae bacterium]